MKDDADQTTECAKCKGQKGCCITVEEIEVSDEEMERIIASLPTIH